MKIICEMYINEFFKLSSDQLALIGKVDPDIEMLIPASKADLYVENKKVSTINVIGEDRFFGVNENKHLGRRAIRTFDDITSILVFDEEKKIKLIIYN